MARPRKLEGYQTKKIVVYVDEQTKGLVQSASVVSHLSESQIGEIAIKSYLSKGGTTMQYDQNRDFGNLTGSLQGGDILRDLYKIETNFSCELDGEKWEGKVRLLESYGSFFEFNVVARGSSFICIAGPYSNGWVLSFPSHEVCLDLAEPSDLFYNEEKALSCRELNRVDGVSAVRALKVLYRAMGE